MVNYYNYYRKLKVKTSYYFGTYINIEIFLEKNAKQQIFYITFSSFGLTLARCRAPFFLTHNTVKMLITSVTTNKNVGDTNLVLFSMSELLSGFATIVVGVSTVVITA